MAGRGAAITTTTATTADDDEEEERRGGGGTTEDMRVIATMIDPGCLQTEFSLHRNRRALLNVFPLGCFSNNHRQLIPLFAPVCELIVVGNGDEGLNALALS